MVEQQAAEAARREGLPAAFVCPITLVAMRDPVVDREGNSYERTAIKEWMRTHTTSPLSRKPLSADHLVENRLLRNAIDEHYEKTGQKRPSPPQEPEQVRIPLPLSCPSI